MSKKTLLITCIGFMVATGLGLSLYFDAFGSGDDAPQRTPKSEAHAGTYAFIEYEHDWLDPATAFLKIMAHPGDTRVPQITGGYAQTDVFAFVRIRGIDTHRAMHHVDVRKRPHRWIERERENWDTAMQYVWNVTRNTRTLRLSQIKIKKCDPYLQRLTGDTHILEADWEYYLGGTWHNLGTALMLDEHARPQQADGTEWDGGSQHYSLEHPHLPK